MEAKFIAIVERLVREQGKDTLINAAKCKAHLADYSQNEFKKERHLLMIAIEAGCAKEIANANDLAICKKIQIRFLQDERFIDERLASEAIDLLAFVLRGDKNKSIVSVQSQNTQVQSPAPQSPPQQQSRYTAPSPQPNPAPSQTANYSQPNQSSANAPKSQAIDWINNVIKTIVAIAIGIGGGIIIGLAIGCFIFFAVTYIGSDGLLLWEDYDWGSSEYKRLRAAGAISEPTGVVCGFIAGLLASIILSIKLTPLTLKKSIKNWIRNWHT
jgi:hypothetical protein